tara:strand:- start:442 stop:585 length:144 start_codon:yes stop_codon:yes gene_type:complete
MRFSSTARESQYGLIGKDSLEPAADYFLDIDFFASNPLLANASLYQR